MRPVLFAFDIDGVVIESEALHFEALKRAINQDLHPHIAASLIGLSLEETLKAVGVERRLHPQVSAEAERLYVKSLSSSNLRPGIEEVIKWLSDEKWAFGFVSSASRAVCEANLDLLGLPDKPALVSRDDVKRTKPEAEPYVKLCAIMGFPPERTVAIEDSDIGIRAASAARIGRIYAWPHALSGRQTYTQCDQVISHLQDIRELHDVWSGRWIQP